MILDLSDCIMFVLVHEFDCVHRGILASKAAKQAVCGSKDYSNRFHQGRIVSWLFAILLTFLPT
jgi:hypothetical protein